MATIVRARLFLRACVLGILVLSWSPLPAQTELGTLAESLQPGTWAELTTNNLSQIIDATDSAGVPRSIFEFADGGGWDPLSEEFFFVGGGHQSTQKFVVYSAQTNTWSRLPDPSWFPPFFHGFDHTAIDVSRGELFHHPFGIGERTIYRYIIAQQSWNSLPPIPGGVTGYVECCRGVEYFPELGALIVVTIGEVYSFSFASGDWQLLATGLPMGAYENFAEYNPLHGVIIFGGGLGNRRLHMLDAQGVITPLADAPTPLGITFAVVTVDPVSGDYLVLADNLRLYAYDVLQDAWTILDNNPPIPTEFGDAYNVVATSVSNYGVTMWVSSFFDFSLQGSVWLYKRAELAPDITPPTVALAAVTSPVSDSVTLSASASDDVGVSEVRFLVDGALIGTDTAAPYEVLWESTSVTNGVHILTAEANDAAGNVGVSAPRAVTVDNEPPPPGPGTLQFSSAAYSVGEAGGVVTITVQRVGGSDGAVTVDFTTADGSATAGVDYTTTAGTLSWADGDTLGETFTVTILDDTTVEGDETVSLSLANPNGGASLSAPTSATLTIVEDDANQPPEANAVAAYSFDEGAGFNVADASGNNNNGSVVDATWVTPGQFGNALSFDGNGDYVQVLDSASLDITNELTLEAWVFPRTLGGYRIIIDKTTTGQPTNYYLALLGDELNFGFFTGRWREHTTIGVNITPNVWYHVAAVYSDTADNVTLYVNGIEVLSEFEGNLLTGNGETLRIGIGFSGEEFDGNIDEVRIYNQVRSSSEIVTDMNRPIGPPSP